ncbi:hypothetical protein [Oceanobacillus sp. J11TS1]|uniref:hypothetical protein n=1 Tax=Oceanobacillus sp. J11TS1 TaxID=2807191 RepID=UPI001B0E596A|nr:hypothetical protein [Oceanobacillus sp. J11TS1]GIO24697.1 hypothetical protein J11TS1_32780 [Oceanobacillus sp. J11TS1]
MDEVPINSKNILALIIFLLLTTGFTWLYINFNSTIKDEPAEETIELKYSKKGLYLYPRYEIHVSNSDRPSTVSKEQFESVEVGDTISGYMKTEDTFVTEKDIHFEKLLGIPILIVLYLAVLFVGAGLLKSTTFIKNKPSYKNIVQKVFMTSLLTLLGIYILTGLILVTLITTNIFNKVNTWNQTVVTASVLGGDYNETRSQRGASYTTYELFLHFQDQEGKDYITKKAVTGTTYNKYDLDESIPLIYRNNNVYDTFIDTKSANEIWPAFLNLYTILIGFYLISVFAMIRGWRKKKKLQQEEDATLHNTI